MLMEGFIIDTRRGFSDGLETYCKLERIDQLYLAAEKNKKDKTKTNTGNKKKFVIHK